MEERLPGIIQLPGLVLGRVRDDAAGAGRAVAVGDDRQGVGQRPRAAPLLLSLLSGGRVWRVGINARLEGAEAAGGQRGGLLGLPWDGGSVRQGLAGGVLELVAQQALHLVHRGVGALQGIRRGTINDFDLVESLVIRVLVVRSGFGGPYRL